MKIVVPFLCLTWLVQPVLAQGVKLNPPKAPGFETPKGVNISGMTLLSNEGFCTVVPDSSVLYLPEKFKDRVKKAKLSGKYLKFSKFLAQNSSWLQSYQVTVDQAFGKEPLEKGIREKWEKDEKVVISILDKNRVVSFSEFKPQPDKDGGEQLEK